MKKIVLGHVNLDKANRLSWTKINTSFKNWKYNIKRLAQFYPYFK